MLACTSWVSTRMQEKKANQFATVDMQLWTCGTDAKVTKVTNTVDRKPGVIQSSGVADMAVVEDAMVKVPQSKDTTPPASRGKERHNGSFAASVLQI